MGECAFVLKIDSIISSFLPSNYWLLKKDLDTPAFRN